MGIVGIQKDVDRFKLEDIEEEVVETVSKKGEPEFFTTQQLFTDNYWKKLVTRQGEQSKRRELLIERVRDVQRIAQETPLGTNETVGDENMLMVKHRGMAGKTKVVGSTVFVFDEFGVARCSRKDLAAYAALVKQPGYSKYTGEPRRPTPAAPSVPEPVVEPEPEPVVEETASEPEPEPEEERVEEITEDFPVVPDEAIQEEPDWDNFYKRNLQNALDVVGYDYAAAANKSTLVEHCREVWEDEPESRDDLLEGLTEEA